uniref:Zgc:123060 n=2 Tax=Nothobranchius furzeri TaxID=105023 RepID=A0A1A8ADR2_NOTFU
MYVGKRFAFSPPVYEARCLLAALDYNHHNHRPDYITRKNEKSYKRLYSIKSQNYRIQVVKVAKDYSYIPELQRCILRKRMDGGALPRKAKCNPGDPRNLGNLAGVVAPPTPELVQTQIRRGQAPAT